MNNYSQFLPESVRYNQEDLKEFLDFTMKGMKIKLGTTESPFSIYYYKNQEIYLELLTEERILNLSYDKIYSHLQEISIIYYQDELNLFIQQYFQKFLHLQSITIACWKISDNSWKKIDLK